MLFRESQFKLMERLRLFLQSWVGYMRNSWDPRLYKMKEGLDFVRTSFPFFMFRSDSAGLFAKISAHSAGLSAAMWYWRKGRFGVGTRVTYWSCREFFVLGKNFFLCRCWYVHHFQSPVYFVVTCCRSWAWRSPSLWELKRNFFGPRTSVK